MQVQLKHSEQVLPERDLSEDNSLKLQLEGQCKIVYTSLLEFSWSKTVLLTVPIILSIVCLFLLKYYKKLRTKVFYWESNREEATHLFICAKGKREEAIVEIIRKEQLLFFYYKNLKYELLLNGAHVPVAINHEKELQSRVGTSFLASGLSSSEASERKNHYGANEHIVDPPGYFEYMYEIMTEPFFFIQYLAAVIYIIQKLAELAILLMGATIITTSINYILLYISYRKIKEIAEVVVEVQVLRDGSFMKLPSTELVPGDIFIPKNQLFCDVVLLNGQVYVNEANLTGESIPIGKFALEKFSRYRRDDTSKWIYEGSKILSAQNALAIAMHTGYTSKRGRILRKILNRSPATPHFFTTCMYFLVFNYLVGIIVYLATLPVRISNGNLDPIIIFLNFLLVVTFCMPPSSPIYFNLVYSACLVRLKWKQILGTEPEKTVQAAHLKIMCFDKTGTLTEDKVEVNKVYKFQSQNYRDITHRGVQHRGLDEKIFGCCHTVKYFQEQLMGDEIDLKMFLYSQYQLWPQCDSGSCFEVVDPNAKHKKMKIIKIYQYESRFQSMSVLVHDSEDEKYYIFAKGAPEVILSNSTVKYDYFEDLLQNVSYGGFRTLAYGFKEVLKSQIDLWLNQSRQSFIKDIKIMGFLVFQNKLKHDSASTIALLSEAGIESRMITGDNIYIAIETSIRCGILARNQEIMVVEGKDQRFLSDIPMSNQVIQVKRFSFQAEKVIIVKDRLPYNEYMDQNLAMIVDNNFLMLAKTHPRLELAPTIRVYSRISPENKAYIVRMLKKTINNQERRMRKIQKLLSVEVDKVGMVGDGANDLLAIKEADIGVGIRNCDSSYAANFSILELSGLDAIVREAKCGQRTILEIQRFVTIGGMLQIPLLIVMETQAAYFSSFQLLFANITKNILFPLLLTLSRPAQKQTIYKPCSNFLKLQNQLVHWGSAIIGTLTILSTMIYYRTQGEYIWNRTRGTVDSGWVYETSLVTSQFIFYSIHPIFLVFSLYEGNPWKEPIYKNYLLFVIILINIVFTAFMSFFVPQLKGFFSFTEMSYQAMGIVFGIAMIGGILTLIFNSLVSSLRLHEDTGRSCTLDKEEKAVSQRIESNSGGLSL